LPPYLDPNLKRHDLLTGVSFASAASGYDPQTNKIAVNNYSHFKPHNVIFSFSSAYLLTLTITFFLSYVTLVSAIIIRSTRKFRGIQNQVTRHGWRKQNINNYIEKRIPLVLRKQ